MEEKSKTDFLKIVYRAGFLILAGMIIGLLMAKSVLALTETEEIDIKWNYCNSLNYNGSTCDYQWILFKSAIGIPNSTTVNTFNETYLNDKLYVYYNKTDIDNLVLQINNEINTSIKSVNFSAELESRLLQFQTNINGEIAELKDTEKDEDKDEGIDPILLLAGLIILVVVGYFLMQNKKNSSTRYQESNIYSPSKASKQITIEDLNQIAKKVNQQQNQEI